jgi:hypothetical protein
MPDVMNNPHDGGLPFVSYPLLSTSAQDIQSYLFCLCALKS